MEIASKPEMEMYPNARYHPTRNALDVPNAR
jgi:hypothetical protein